MKQSGDIAGLAELDKAPKLNEGDIFYRNAFFDLDTERAHGMQLTRIPRSAMLAYADECGLLSQSRYDFVHVMRRVDDTFLDALAKKRAHAQPD